MRRFGRASVVSILAVVGIAMVLIVLLFSKESVSTVGGRFMDALAQGDVDKLTALTYLGNEPPEQIRKEWEFATQQAAKHYNFRWRITSSNQVDPNSATVNLMVERNFGYNSYEEVFELPLVLVNGVWKVDVGAINREMYPAIPRKK